MTSLVCESFLRFALPPGSRHHDIVNANDTGVDFEIASKPPVWLEVKNWESPVVPPHQRPIQDESNRNKTDARSTFWNSILAKFEGTHDCLLARQERPEDVRLGLLLESKIFSDVALAPMISIFEARIAASPKLAGCRFGVVDAAGLAKIVPGASATPCPVSAYPDCVCLVPVARCSALRRKHSGS